MATHRAKRAPSKYCRQCGYELAHIDGGQCPECGAEFDPNNPTTYAIWQSQLRHRGHEPMVGALVGGIVAMLVVTVGWGWPGGVCAAIPFALLGFMCGFAFIKDRN